MPHALSYNAPPIFVNFGGAMKFGGDPSRTVAEQSRTNGARGASKQTRNSNWILIAAQGLLALVIRGGFVDNSLDCSRGYGPVRSLCNLTS